MSHLFFHLPSTYGLDHFTNGDFGVVRPKDAAIFVFVVVESNSISVTCLQRGTFLQLCTPRHDGVTQIDFMHKELLGWFDLGGNPTRGFEQRGIVSPGARHNVEAMLQSLKSRANGLRRLTWPDDEFGTLSGQLVPSGVEVDVETNLNANLAKIAI